MESGDEIKIQLTTGNDNITFSGKGADKYNLIQNLKEQYTKQYFKIGLKGLKLNDFKDSISLATKLDQFANLIKEFEIRKMNLVNMTKDLNKNVKEIIIREYATYYDDWQFRISYVLYKDNIQFRHLILSYYNRFKNNFFYEPIPLSVISRNYMSNLAERIKFEVQGESNNMWIDLVSYYTALKNKYSGDVRERLLADFVINNSAVRYVLPFNTNIFDSLIKDVQKTVTISYIQQSLNENLKFQNGSKLYTSSFIDLKGNIFNIESLKGKAILIDIWYLGCTGCAEFHRAFKKDIYPFVMDNKNLVILSINIDRKKANWLKGIKSELYTSSNYVNVTTGNGLEHPFMKYYNIGGAPFLILVDTDGNIVSKPIITQVFDHRDTFIDLLNKVSKQ